MAAEPGTLYAIGKSGRRYAVDVYLPDAVAGVVLFNPTGAASSTSPNYWRPPEDVTVTDLSVTTGTTAVGAAFTADGAQFAGNTVRYANHLNTLNNRPYIGWSFRGGSLIGAINV